MRQSAFILVALAVPFCAVLGGCAELYMPRFDGGLENPDIRMLRVPEFMNGVKCGLVAFMREREEKLLEDRKSRWQMYRNVEAPKGSRTKDGKRRTYSPYHLHMTADMRRCGRNEYAKCTRGRCSRPEEWQCVETPCDAALVSPDGTDRRLGVALWDYAARKCVPIPDYNRFALDETQLAQIQLKMTATNSGFIHFSRIDAVKSGLFPFIAIGGINANPFPTLNIDPKRTTTFDLTANIQQSVHTFNQTAVPPAVFTHVGAVLDELGGRVKSLQKGAEPEKFARVQKYEPVMPGFAEEQTLEQIHNDLKERLSADLEADHTNLEEPLKRLVEQVEDLEARAEQLPGAHPGWQENIKTAYRKLLRAARRISALNKKVSGKLEEHRAEIDQERRKLNDLSDEIERETAGLKQDLDHDEKIIASIGTVLRNIADYVNDLVVTAEETKRVNPESVSLALEATAEYSQRLVLAALEIKDPARAKERRGFIEDELSKVRRLLGKLKKEIEAAAASAAAAREAQKVEENIQKAFGAQKQGQEFYDQCKPDIWAYIVDPKTRIDFLGLKSVLENLYDREDSIYRGIPDISLNQLVLTSEFMLSVDVSGGLNYVRFIPIVAAPGAGLEKNLTHNLKVTLTGKKGKGSPGNNTGGKNLVASCEQRVTGASIASDNYCASAEGQLLENVLQALSETKP